MKEKLSLKEKYLWDIWLSGRYNKPLKTVSGELVEVINPGFHNKDKAGPDFENARLKINGITYAGDIEIDLSYSDWKAHNHNLDKRFNKISLHLSFFNPNSTPFVYSCYDRKIPTVCLESFLPNELVSAIIKESELLHKKNGKIKCAGYNSSITENDKLEYLGKLGLERLNKKTLRIFERLKELVYVNQLRIAEPVYRYEPDSFYFNMPFDSLLFHDKALWEQVLYEFLFEALGYSQNKKIMMNLARAVPLSYIRANQSEEVSFVYLAESLLFNVSGLLSKDDNEDPYTCSLKKIWAEIKIKYDGELLEETSWNFFRLRPSNFPTLRIAAGARLAAKLLNENLLNSLIDAFTNEIRADERKKYIKNILVIDSDGYWEDHYIFGKESDVKSKYLLGISRVDEMIINVLIPYIILYAKMFNLKDVYRNAVKLYLDSQLTEKNSMLDNMIVSLGLGDIKLKGIETQGILELKKTRCDFEKCSECYIGEILINSVPSFS